jgi:hypothetical protein
VPRLSRSEAPQASWAEGWSRGFGRVHPPQGHLVVERGLSVELPSLVGELMVAFILVISSIPV